MKKKSRKNLHRRLVPSLCIAAAIYSSAAVNAESVTFQKDGYTYFVQNDTFAEGWIIHEGIFTVDGIPAYCIEPKETVRIGEDLYETGSWDTYNGYPDNVKKRITEYTWFGYGHEGFGDMNSWYATQILIWRAINSAFDNTHVWRDPAYDGSKFMSSQSIEITSDIETRMREIQAKVDEYHIDVKPVYTGSDGTVLSEPLTLTAGETLKIHDEAGILHKYILSEETAGVTQKGDDVYIDTKRSGSVNLTFRYEGMDETLEGAPLLLKSKDGSKIQTLVVKGKCDAREFSVKVNVNDVSLKLIKRDASAAQHTFSENGMAGAEYEVRNETEDRKVGILRSAEGGISEALGGLNLSDTYSIHEVKAPKGYRLDEEVRTFRLNDLPLNNGIYEITMEDSIVTGLLALHKMIASRTNSGISVNEEGAGFTVLSERAVKEYGSFEEALKHIEEIPVLEKAVMTTDSKGYCQSGPLAYGSYIVRQTKASDEDLELCDDFVFTVSEQLDSPVLYEVSNLKSEYQLRIIKKDAETGKEITFSPAVFEIYREDGTKLTQKVGSAVYERFMTSSMQKPEHIEKGTYCDTSSEPGMLVLPLSLEAGKYELREVAAPEGYLVSETPLSFEVGSTAVSEDEVPCIEVIFENQQDCGSLSILKTISTPECDVSLITEDHCAGIEFTLFTKEDLISMRDGSLIARAGSEYAKLITDSEGKAALRDLPYGHYVLKETKTNPGLLLSEREYEVIIDGGHRELSFEIENEAALTKFSKKAASGADELPGAQLCVRKEDGTVVDEWISTESEHIICGLNPDETYILSESLTPRDENGEDAGYVKSEEIRFKPSADHENNTVTMTDTLVTVIKCDGEGNAIKDAHLEVYDENGELVDSWITDGTEHRIKGLKASHTYTLHEAEAPDGYYLSYDITFTADGQRDLNLTMTDSPIYYEVRKIDEISGLDLSGVTLSLYEVSDEEEVLVDSWVTDGSAHEIGHLMKAGATYRLEETEAVSGVFAAADMIFTCERYDPEDEASVIITMIDAAVSLSAVKTDHEGRYLKGAHLQIEDDQGNIIHKWISEEKPEDLSPYVTGSGRYLLRETQAPQGYAICSPVFFTVSGNTEEKQMIRAVDRIVRIHLDVLKTDSDTGRPLQDCEVSVYRVSDDEIAVDLYGSKAVQKTDKDGKAVFSLPYDEKGYYVRETKAPKGYKLNPEKFMLNLIRENNPPVVFEEITITDQRKAVSTGISLSDGSYLIYGGLSLLFLTLLCVFFLKSRQCSH